MFTVESIIERVYGDDRAASERLKVGVTAICNWKKWGHFPLRLVFQIAQDARDVGIEMLPRDVPVAASQRRLLDEMGGAA